jgi:hypothetical protein
MPKCIVACYSPPAGFLVNDGDTVDVQGLISDKKIVRATNVRDVTTKGPVWICGVVPKALLPKLEPFKETGKASNVVVLADSVQFVLTY